MKRIYVLVSMRDDLHPDYDETRNSLDKRWISLLSECGLLPIMVPNSEEIARQLITEIPFKGLILTGGNSLSKYGGDSSARDKTEEALLSAAIDKDVPVLGVCRGFQFLLDYFGEKLVPVNDHVAVRHPLKGSSNSAFGQYIESLDDVNSFHTYAALYLHTFQVMATAPDNHIEAAIHPTLPIYGIMWHPERDPQQVEASRRLLTTIFLKQPEY